MRKTKIICTLGPSTDSPEILKNMVQAGMNVARFNFSHGTHDEHLSRLQMLINIRDELDVPIATMLDTKGPEIRLKNFENGFAQLIKGQLFTLTTKDILGDATICSITYPDLPKDVSVGDHILMDDGLISLKITSITDTDIACLVENDGIIKDKKSINLPGIRLSVSYISEKDKEDFLFGIKHNFDFLACSFVRSADDILQVRTLLKENGCDTMRIISKIENDEGIRNIDEIIEVSDGIMIARGDMGVEIDFTQIPMIQKQLISKCYTSGKPAITATQMLESMVTNPRPTRAETTDVANAVYDGTSAIMLSGETASGKYPVEAVSTMSNIAKRAEESIDYIHRFYTTPLSKHLSIADAVSHSACGTAINVDAKAIVTVSKSGKTARFISKWRPAAPIIACVTDDYVYRQLALSWGVTPLLMAEVYSTDELFLLSAQTAKKAGFVAIGDTIVTTAGVPVGIAGTTNILKADVVL